MNPEERLHLDKLIKANNVEDNTENIRKLKHSEKIKDDIITLLKLKTDYQRLARTNPSQFDTMCINRCSFLFNNYTDIFNRIKKDELDLQIMFQLLAVLKAIEDGKLDQHEGSFLVGALLKELYVDSALRKAEKLDEQNKEEKVEPKKPEVQISWKQFKAASQK